LFRFFKLMIKFRQSHPPLRRRQYYWGEKDRHGRPEITWHGVELEHPDWSHESHSFAFTLSGFEVDADIHIMISAYTERLRFELPEPQGGRCWSRVVDTSLSSPDDIAEDGEGRALSEATYELAPRSIAVLIGRPNPHALGTSASTKSSSSS
jgi:isoamylase